MIDTVAIKLRTTRGLSDASIGSRRWRPYFCGSTGDLLGYRQNGARGAHEPRLQTSRRHGFTYLRVEVSLPYFQFGTNVRSLEESEIRVALKALSNFVSDIYGADIDLAEGEVCRADFVDDRFVDPADVPDFFRRVREIQIPRMINSTISSTTVQWLPRAKKGHRKLVLYCKQRERLDNHGSEDEIASAAGQIRLEITLRTRELSKLASDLGIPGRRAVDLLSGRSRERVLSRYRELLNVESFLGSNERDDLLHLVNNPEYFSLPFAGYVALVDRFGQSFAKDFPGLISVRNDYKYRAERRKLLASAK